MNRFIIKKVVKKMNTMKTRAAIGLLSVIGTWSRATLSTALNIMFGHISKEEISKKVIIELNMLS